MMRSSRTEPPFRRSEGSPGKRTMLIRHGDARSERDKSTRAVTPPFWQPVAGRSLAPLKGAGLRDDGTRMMRSSRTEPFFRRSEGSPGKRTMFIRQGDAKAERDKNTTAATPRFRQPVAGRSLAPLKGAGLRDDTTRVGMTPRTMTPGEVRLPACDYQQAEIYFSGMFPAPVSIYNATGSERKLRSTKG
jgi:hypothetical protein